MKFSFLTAVYLLVGNAAMASSQHGGHGDNAGVPTVVIYQAINVAIIIGVAIYLGRNKVAAFFLEKRNHFLQAQEKAQGYLKQAERDYSEIKTRLEKLTITKTESIAKAKADAKDLQVQMVQDAQAMALKIQGEAQLTAKLEIERAKQELKDQLVREAFELSKKDLGSKATSADQKKLQDDFISKVQVVQ